MPTQLFTPNSFQTFGDLLKYLRRRERLTQLELSITVGYSEAQISRLEQNQRLPDLTALKALFIPALHIDSEPEIIRRLIELAQSARQEDAPLPGIAPYKGLLYFDESDSDLFFGREALTKRLADRVKDLAIDSSSRFLAVVGASGSGKSSLVRAGLVYALKRAGWDTRVFTPTANPMKAWDTQLYSNHARVKSEYTLILVDQFEETFTLCHDETERLSFIENLLDISQDKSGKTVVVIALRADFYSHCAQYPLLRQAVAAEQEYIGQMSADELRRAIEEPAKRGGWEFEPGLVDVLLSDIGAEGTGQPEPGALPLLSHALLATWERRRGRTFTLNGYHASGGVRGAIAETAESVFTDQLNLTQQGLARDVFLRLTELGEGTEDTRRRAALNELVRQSSEAAQLRAVLNTLAEARLITLNEDSAEVAHEALIREWQRLHEWLTQDREGLRLHRHLTDSAQEWETRGRDVSELYRGARLAQVNEWASANEGRLNESESAFLKASIEQEQHDASEREAQRQRELEAAQKLADTQKQANVQLRRRALYLAGAFVITLIMAFTALYFGDQARRSAEAAHQSAAAAQTSAEQAKSEKVIATSRELAVQSKLNLSTDTERSVLLALAAYNTSHTQEAINALHEAVLDSRVLLTVKGSDTLINDVAFSPNGERFASAGADHIVGIWDAATGQELFHLTGHTDEVEAVRFSPDGRQLASGSADGSVKLWDSATGKLMLTINAGAPVSTMEFGPDGKWIVIGAAESKVGFWDTNSGQEFFELADPDWATSPNTWQVDSLSLSQDGESLAIGLGSQNDTVGRLELWDVKTRQRERILDEGTSTLFGTRTISFSPDGTRLATRFWGDSSTPAVWDTATGRQLYHLNVIVNGIAFSSDGRHLFTATSGGKAQVWDAETGQVLLTLVGHDDVVAGVSGNSECVTDGSTPWCGTRLVSSGLNGIIKVWDITPDGRGEGPIFAGSDFAINQDWSHLTTLVTNTNEQKVLTTTFQKWISTGMELNPLSVSDSFSLDAPISQVWGLTGTGQWLAFSPDGTINILDGMSQAKVPTSICCFNTKNVSGGPTFPVTSADQRLLAFGDDNENVEVWDVKSQQQVASLNLTDSGQHIKVMAFSPDGQGLAVGFNESVPIKIWDITANHLSITLSGQSGQPASIAFSPNGKLIAAGNCDTSIYIWDAITGERKFDLEGHSACITALAFNSDNTLLASASPDQTTRVWDLKTGKELMIFPMGGVSPRLAFSPDNKFLLASVAYNNSDKYDTRIFLVDPNDLVVLAKSRLTRSLTTEECQQYLHVDTCPSTEP